MGRPRSAALEGLVIGLDCTGRGSCSKIRSISSRQLTCNPMHATCRTQDDDDVSLPIASCYRSYMQPRAFAMKRLVLHDKAISSARARAKSYRASY
jgi:hypothetical protein